MSWFKVMLIGSTPAKDFEGDDVKFYLFAFTTDDAGNLSNDAYFNSVKGVDHDGEPPIKADETPPPILSTASCRLLML